MMPAYVLNIKKTDADNAHKINAFLEKATKSSVEKSKLYLIAYEPVKDKRQIKRSRVKIIQRGTIFIWLNKVVEFILSNIKFVHVKHTITNKVNSLFRGKYDIYLVLIVVKLKKKLICFNKIKKTKI